MAFPNWDFNSPVVGDSTEEMRRENQRLKEELHAARSMNHQIHNTNQENLSVLRNDVAGQTQSNNDFSWDDIINEEKKNSQPAVAPTTKTGMPKFQSQQELDEYLEKKQTQFLMKQQQQQMQLAQYSQKLFEKFKTENPDLLPHSDLIGQLWSSSIRLNPNLHPDTRYSAVLEESKKIIARGYTNSPNKHSPYGHNPPGNGYTVRNMNQQEEVSLEYNPDEHAAELAARKKFIQDRILS